MKKKQLLATTVLGLVTVCLVGWAASRSYDPPGLSPEEHQQVALQRHQTRAVAINAMHAGDYAAARSHFAEMANQQTSDFDRVEGHRMLSLSHRHEGSAVAASASLDDAVAAFDASADLQARFPWLRGTLLMDRAELAAFHTDNKATAIDLYDLVRTAGPNANDRDKRIASQNAAVLCADLSRFPEACQRLDELLSSPLSGDMRLDEVISLRNSQASWYAQSGNLNEAFNRGLRLWQDFQDSNDPAILEAGATVASWYAVPTHCAERTALLRVLFVRLDTARMNLPADSDVFDRLLALEQDVLYATRDSFECGDDVLNQMAAARVLR